MFVAGDNVIGAGVAAAKEAEARVENKQQQGDTFLRLRCVQANLGDKLYVLLAQKLIRR